MPKDKIIEDGMHPHPGPKDGGRRRIKEKTTVDKEAWAKKMKRRIMQKRSHEEHFLHCMAMEEGTAPSIIFASHYPPASHDAQRKKDKGPRA